jgi:GTP 3',8-cyclase
MTNCLTLKTFLTYLKKNLSNLKSTFIKDLTNPTLTALLIEINSACNRKCVWCPNCNANRPQNKYLDDFQFYSIIDQMVEMEFRGKITFNLYNEPLLDKRLSKFIKYVREKLPFSFIYLNTNGDYLNLEFWSLLRKEGLDYANISQYDGRINENVKKILEHLDIDEKQHFAVRIFDPLKINNRAGLINSASKLPLKRFCNRPFYQLCITYEGKIVICCNDYFGQVEIGDFGTKTIKEIWANEIFVRYRKELKKGNRANLELCKTCDRWH